MFARDILAEKGADVTTTGPDVSIGELARLLMTHRIGAVVVLDDTGGVVGVISERDIVNGLGEKGADSLSLSVADLMTREVVTCGLDTAVDELMSMMTTGRIRHVPILVDGLDGGDHVIGDLARQLLQMIETVVECAGAVGQVHQC